MSFSSGIHTNGTGIDTSTRILDLVHFNYPWVLLVVFLVAFTTHSILTAESTDDSAEPLLTGPGGKPLPRSARKTEEERRKRKLQDFSPVRKLLFLWLSAGILATFLGNAINIVVHALDKRENGWWCGEATAVSSTHRLRMKAVLTIPVIDIYLRFSVFLQRFSYFLSRHYTIPFDRSSGYVAGCTDR